MLGDIHGNLPALDAAFAEFIEENGPSDQVPNGGTGVASHSTWRSCRALSSLAQITWGHFVRLIVERKGIDLSVRADISQLLVSMSRSGPATGLG